MGPLAASVTSVIGIPPVDRGELRANPGDRGSEGTHAWDRSAPTLPHVCEVIRRTAEWAPGKSKQTQPGFFICSLQGGARDQEPSAHGRLFRGCPQHGSPGSPGEPQQGASQSGARAPLQEPAQSGTLGTWGHSPDSGQGCPWLRPSTLWLGGLWHTNVPTHKCALPGDVRLKVTARTELPEC